MSPFLSLLKKCNPDPTKAGKTLLVLNALGMVFAAISNTFAAAIDKNTTKEDKKFLVPAGAVTGVANIGLYYLLTDKVIIKGLTKAADKYVKEAPKEELSKNATEIVLKQVRKAEKSLFKKAEDVASLKANLLDKNNVATQKAVETYKENIKSGAGVMGAFIGAVVGCAILTPIIRDVSAYFVQKKMEKKYPEMQQKPYRPYFDPAHIGEGRYKYTDKPLSLRSYMLATNGRTRI